MARHPEAITLAFLETCDDGILESQLLEYVLALASRDGEAVEHLPRSLQAHYIAFVGDGEILNGGFNQLFSNDPTLALDLPEALRHLRLAAAAAIADDALARYEVVCPGLQAAREAGTVEAFIETYDDQPFDDLDAAYGALEEPLRLGRIAYVRAHPEEFLHRYVAG